MALKLRLARHGAKKKPYYRIVVADSRSPRDGRFIDRIGSYDPMLPKDSENRVQLDIEKVKDWLGKGARPTERVARLLGAAGLWQWTAGNNPIKGKPGAKAEQLLIEKKEKEEARKAAEAEAAEAAKQAAKLAEEAAKAADAAPILTEEPVTEEPVTEEPVAEEPVAEEGLAETPETDTSAMDAPAAKED